MKRRNRQSGQSFILLVMIISLVTTSIALMLLGRAQRALTVSVAQRRAMDVMSVLNATSRWLQHVYTYEAGCDPYQLNIRINELPQRQFSTPFDRESLSGSAQPYMISIGEITAKKWNVTAVAPFVPKIPAAAPFGLPPIAPERPEDLSQPVGSNAAAAPAILYKTTDGMFGPQDVSVTFWLKPFQKEGGIDRVGVRYEQTVTLLNNCVLVDPNTTTAVTSGPFVPSYSPGPQFGRVSTTFGYYPSAQGAMPGLSVPTTCTDRLFGDIDENSVTNLTDYEILKNWVMNLDTTGVLTPATVATNPCLDLNHDGVVNEVDLSILEKAMKGYFYYYSVSSQ